MEQLSNKQFSEFFDKLAVVKTKEGLKVLEEFYKYEQKERRSN